MSVKAQRRRHIRATERACNPLRHLPLYACICVYVLRGCRVRLCAANVCLLFKVSWLLYSNVCHLFCRKQRRWQRRREGEAIEPKLMSPPVCCHNSTVMCINSVVDSWTASPRERCVIMWDTLNIPSVAQVQLLDLHPFKVAADCPIGVGGGYLLSTSADWGLTWFIDGSMDKLVLAWLFYWL